MADIAALWDRLRTHGLQDLAPTLVQSGVRSLSDVSILTNELLAQGVKPWQLEMITQEVAVVPAASAQIVRKDIAPVVAGQRASAELAFSAASVNNRKRSLAELENAFLAPSTQPAVESRVKLYVELCAAWEVAPWPISYESLKCFAASLKAGRYRSASLYFHAAFSHQLRVLAIPLADFLKQSAKMFNRAITRGLGAST